MTEPPADSVNAVQPSEPALLAVLDACEEYVCLHHDLLRAASRARLGPADLLPLAAQLDQLRSAASEARRHLSTGQDGTL